MATAPGQFTGHVMTKGRPKELQGKTTRHVVFDARTVATVELYRKVHGGSFSNAVRQIVAAYKGGEDQ